MLPLANWVWEEIDFSGMWVVLIPFLLIGLAIYLVVITWIEGYLMAVLKWGSQGCATRDAAIANTVCIALTIMAVIFLAPTSVGRLYNFTTLVPTLVILWAWSVGVKGISLLLMRCQPAYQIWRTVLIANTVMYAVGGLIVAILFRPQLL